MPTAILADSVKPRMIVVAGPPGSGKSTLFPVAGFGVDFFNADDRAAELNRGSYLAIPPAIRQQVNREFESFVADRIVRGRSFAFETTLRSGITFEQARQAKASGFLVEMRYLALGDFDLNLERVRIRADDHGHSAPASVLRGFMRRASEICRVPLARWITFASMTTAVGERPRPCYWSPSKAASFSGSIHRRLGWKLS